VAVKVQDRLAAELNVTAEDLGLDDGAFSDRVKIWGQLAATGPDQDAERVYQRVKAHLLRNWITSLTRDADKFRSEGEITVETNILGRIALLQQDLKLAMLGSGTGFVLPGTANPAPEFEAWGVDGGWQ